MLPNRFSPSFVQYLEGLSRKLLLVPGALCLGAAGGSAQALAGTPGELVLSRRADLATQDRHFRTDETLFVSMPVAAERRELDGTGAGLVGGRWTLASGDVVVGGDLVPRGGSLGAAIELGGLDGLRGHWRFTAESLWRGATVARSSAELTLELVAPIAAGTADRTSGEAPLAVRFEDQSQGLVTALEWDFGDGQRSSERTPEHLYRAPGAYTVALVARNPAGEARTTLSAPIVVREQDLALHYGMNLSENAWWQRGIAFADAMARAGEFFRVVNGTIGRVPAPLHPLESGALGAGWPDTSQLAPGEKAGTRLFGNMAGSMPDGRVEPYVLTWEGSGTCRLVGSGVVREENRSAQRVEVFVDPTTGGGNALLLWQIDESDPADPVRNAHVWLPGMEATKPAFWPPFVAKLQAMNDGRGPVAVRAMDWNEVNQYGRTDGSAPFVFDFDGRITPASPSQGTKRGVAPEYPVLLCNALGADLVFNVPHRTDALAPEDYDRFLRDTLTRIRDGSAAVPGVNGDAPFPPLAPGLRLVLEYSNEIWNSIFPVHPWLRARAQAQGRTLHQQAAEEIRHVFALAEEVFAGEHRARLATFVGGHLTNPAFLLEVLAALGPDVQVDSAGPAFYFGPRRDDIELWMTDAQGGSCPNCPTPEAVLDSARLRIAEVDLKLLEHQLIAAAHTNPDGSTTRLELYEAGASFTAGFQPWGPAATDAQRLPAMYDAYVQDLVPAMLARGVARVHWYSLVTDFAQGNAGPFGHWERMDQTITLPVPDVYVHEGAPKAAAVYRLPPRRE